MTVHCTHTCHVNRARTVRTPVVCCMLYVDHSTRFLLARVQKKTNKCIHRAAYEYIYEYLNLGSNVHDEKTNRLYSSEN